MLDIENQNSVKQNIIWYETQATKLNEILRKKKELRDLKKSWVKDSKIYQATTETLIQFIPFNIRFI